MTTTTKRIVATGSTARRVCPQCGITAYITIVETPEGYEFWLCESCGQTTAYKVK